MGAKGLVWMKVGGRRHARVAGRQVPLRGRAGAASAPRSREAGRPAADRRRRVATTCEVLGTLRNDLGRPPVHEGPYRYLWVVDFPMFVGVDEATGRPKPGHHPFTQPHPDDVHLLETDPLSVRSQAYDLVLNGWELGSGSIRIHQPELQARIFGCSASAPRRPQRKFGFFLNPFQVRRPAARRLRVRHRPPGGDPGRRGEHPRGHRLPEDPDAGSTSSDPMTNAPTPVANAAKQLDELGGSASLSPPEGRESVAHACPVPPNSSTSTSPECGIGWTSRGRIDACSSRETDSASTGSRPTSIATLDGRTNW
jgi:aspartyl-tRNA synthetase